jgi:cobalt-zinc-cadmium efflux system membrane fusion protein
VASKALALAGAATLLLAGCSGGKDDASAPPQQDNPKLVLTAAQRQHIRLYTVASYPFRKTIETTGTVDFDNDRATSVLAPFSGPVTRLLVAVGQHVGKGQPLAVVESPDFAAAVGNYRKALATARNARKLADVDRDLVAHDGIARREAEQAQTDAAGAEADRDAARQALVALDVDPGTVAAVQAGRLTARIGGVIRSPIAGTAVEKQITPGQLLQAGSTPCFTIADLSQMWVLAQLSSSDSASVGLHDPAEIEAGAGAPTLTGTVDYISALVDADTRSLVARVKVDNPGDLLKKQMYVRVRIRSRQQSSGLTLPSSAVLRDDDNLPFVYLARPDGSFARQHVALGYRDGERYEVTDGLQAGSRVVVDGAIFLQFMQSQ